ncbi:Uncharacterised protein [Vibrio cholerae]|nr:Uncharacterised protein [Vibrio cholerae]CSI53226.1 Uncharacterised protein [Vibrio cholerae]CSI71644.1 Uncharacterised protein [Vibrio cholerae]
MYSPSPLRRNRVARPIRQTLTSFAGRQTAEGGKSVLSSMAQDLIEKLLGTWMRWVLEQLFG